MSRPSARTVDLIVVGAGPAGLAAAIELRRLGATEVIAVDRESEAGGIPRHANHIGFGMRDLHRITTGPQYARRYVDLAERAGVDVRTCTSVTGWANPTALSLTSPAGIDMIAARAIVLATGCRERPRSARLIPGDRPLGVFTTGTLQQLVYLHHQRAGRRAVVIGAEHVSFSAVLTLAHAGAVTVAMVTEHPRHQTYAPYRWLSTGRLRVPILTSQRVTRIIGGRRVEAVELTDVHTGARRLLACDTVVVTGDWIPDHELARRGGLIMDPATRAPRVDGALRTSARGVFAAGNLIHAAESADVAALSGRHVAQTVAAFLDRGQWPDSPSVPIGCRSPLRWVSPSAVSSADPPPRRRFLWRVDAFVESAELRIRQGRRVLFRNRYRHLVPTMPLRAPADWLPAVDLHGDAITFELGD